MATQKLKQRPPKNPKPAAREFSCSASNGGASSSASCNSGVRGDVKNCMKEVKENVGLPT